MSISADAIEAAVGALRAYSHSESPAGDVYLIFVDSPVPAKRLADRVLAAASREIDCPAERTRVTPDNTGHPILLIEHPDDCDLCGGSGRLRVLL